MSHQRHLLIAVFPSDSGSHADAGTWSSFEANMQKKVLKAEHGQQLAPTVWLLREHDGLSYAAHVVAYAERLGIEYKAWYLKEE